MHVGRKKGSAVCKTSAASTMTDVVPSPTSSSVARDNSIMDLGCGMAHIDFAQDAVPVIRQDDGSHGIEQHFEHAARTQCGANNVGDGFGGLNVGQLCLTARLALRLLVYFL